MFCEVSVMEFTADKQLLSFPKMSEVDVTESQVTLLISKSCEIPVTYCKQG